MARTENQTGGHDLHLEAAPRFDGNGQQLLSCHGCGLRMSASAASNKFWQRNPCDGKGVAVTLISTAKGRVERQAVLDQLPHTWRRKQPATANSEPQPLFGGEPSIERPVRMSVQAARKIVYQLKLAKKAERDPALYALRALAGRKVTPTTTDYETGRNAARNDVEREAVETLIARWT